MRPDSKELAHRIDVMVAFQNKEDVQFRDLNLKRNTRGDAPWSNTFGNLGFDWGKFEYRLKPTTPREGYIFANHLHTHPHDFSRETKGGTYFLVREVLGNK